MVCTVYEPGYAMQVIFASETFDVRPECRAWTRTRAGIGFLWGYQPARRWIEPTESKRVCLVADRAGVVAARVIQVAGLLGKISAAQTAHASSACSSLLASGWVRLAGRRALAAHR
jgi:hypothetical protein